MVDVSITAGNVSLRASPSASVVQVGEAVTPMQPIYLKAADAKYYLGDANDSAMAAVVGIAVTPASADEYTYMVTAGPIDIGGTTVKGTTYILSATAGGIAPIADYASGMYKTILGTAEDTSGTITLAIKATGQVKA